MNNPALIHTKPRAHLYQSMFESISSKDQGPGWKHGWTPPLQDGFQTGELEAVGQLILKYTYGDSGGNVFPDPQ